MSLGCDSGWIGYNHHCYQRQNGGLTYADAKDNCKRKGAIIAVPNTQAENYFLTTKMNPNSQNHTWIGYLYGYGYYYQFKHGYEKHNMWEDGTSHSGTDNWRKLEKVEDYVNRDNGKPVTFMRANGDWSFDSEDNSYYFVCEKTLGVLYDDKIT